MLKNNKFKLPVLIVSTITIVTIVFTMFSSAVFAQRVREGFKWSEKANVSWNEKIDTELWDTMAEKTDDELIPVWLWLKDIDNEIITKAMIEEKGLDPAIYEDEERFNEEIVPEITQQIEELVGYEEAYKTVLPEQMNEEEKRFFREAYNKAEIPEVFNEEDEDFLDRSVSLADKAVNAEVDEYIVAKREIISREYSALNNEFIHKNIGNKKREIIYNSHFTSTLIIEATKTEIEAYAKNETVEGISLFVDLPKKSSMDILTQQINADNVTGTKSSNFNNKSGYKGTNVRIGIIEMEVYDHSLPQFSGIHNKRLFKPTLPNMAVPSIGDHATLVTSIIVGQSATSGGRVYEGVVPMATVYQVAAQSLLEDLEAIKALVAAPYYVNVINYSAGYIGDGILYGTIDKEFDRIIANTGVTFIKSAGNDGTLTNSPVTSPGKALNVITVGNAITKSLNGTNSLNTPYNLSPSSSFGEAVCLPNKPDVTAPGSYVNCIGAYQGQPQLPSGTSFAAPMVAGVVAQMMQASSSLKTNSRAVKSKLLLASDDSKITTTNNPVASDSQHLREKSGAGFLDSVKAVNTAINAIGVDLDINSSTEQRTKDYYFRAGQKVRAVMVYDKKHTNIIQSADEMDIIDFYLNRQNGNVVAMSVSDRNNVRIIEYQFSTDGYYYFSASPYRLIKNAGQSAFAGVSVHISFLTDPIAYSVTYDANAEGDPTGGILPIDNNLYAPNEIVNVKSGTLTRDGYFFLGWTTNKYATGSTANNSGQSFTMPANHVTLYANWSNTFEAKVNGLDLTFKVLSGGTKPTVQVGSGGYQTGVNFQGGHFVIPQTISYAGTTYTVTAIGSWAFSGGKETEITFPSSLKEIRSDAFGACSLGDVTFPEGMLYLGSYAFSNCRLKSLTIPDSLIEIGSGAFMQCTGFTSVTIPNANIREYAFEYSTLKNVTLGSNVSIIEEKAFANCVALTSVTNMAITPQAIHENVFSDYTYQNAILSIPRDSYYSYAHYAAYGWRDFRNKRGV